MAANTISSSLQENVVILGTEALSQSFALLDGVQMNATPDPGNRGESYNVAKYATLTSGSVTAANVSPDVDAVTLNANTITLANHEKAAFKMTGREFQGNNLDPLFANQVKEAVRAVVFGVNANIWALYKKAPYLAGDASRSIFNNGSTASTDGIASVGKVLRDNLVPDSRWKMFISPTEELNAKKVATLVQANTFGSRDVIYDGYIGRVMGFDIAVDQQVPTHTTGTITTGLITKAATAIAVGATTFTATTAASTGACALKTGDIISIGGYTYALSADATQASAATDVTLSIYGGIRGSALAGGEAITLATGHGTGEIGIAGDMSGFGLVNRIEASSFYGNNTLGNKMIFTHPTGFSLVMGLYEQYHQAMWEVSCLYGTNVIDERKLCRVLGA